MADSIRVSVAFALPDRVFLRELRLPTGCTVAAAVEASGLYHEHPEARSDEPHFGVYSRRVDADTALRDGDRIEVYRPLALDPKQARRLRAGKPRDGKD